MTDLERFFHELVRAAAAEGPGRLREPIRMADVWESLLPYRTSRRRLGVDTSEDYELLVLRLAAGEGGLADLSPSEARERLAAEAAGSNPDLDQIRAHGEAALLLRPRAVAEALAHSPDARYAPSEPAAPPSAPPGTPPAAAAPEPPPSPSPSPPPPTAGPETGPPAPVVDDEIYLDAIRFSRESVKDLPAPGAPPGAPGYCAYCGAAQPSDRVVNFCPECGSSPGLPRCPDCRSAVEPGWRFCVTCGRQLGR